MIQHLIHKLDKGDTVRISFILLEELFPPIRDTNTILQHKPILVSSEECFKKWCSENKYFYQHDINNNTYLISK